VSDPQSKLQKYSAPALEKGLDIIEFLSLTDSAPSLSQLAAGIGRSKSEIFRMMIVLEERGYIQRSRGDQFVLTDRLSILGAERPLNNKLADLATPVLLELSDKTRYSCHLSVLQKKSFVVVAHATLATSYGLSVQIGHTFPVINTSAGACYLSFLPEHERIRLLSFLDDQEQRNHSDFEEAIEKCRLDHLVSMPSLESDSIYELSAPVLHTSQNGTVAVVTIPYMDTNKGEDIRQGIAQELITATQLLQDKISITMPNLVLPSPAG
jgi:DNA-binding IclR family transcriptional regulator